jgi:hypothetical protein
VIFLEEDERSYSNCIICLVSPSSLMLGLHCRNMAYDSSLGGCLHALHSRCADDVVKLTAADLVTVFLQSLWRTKSQELKVNFEKCCYQASLVILVRHFSYF